MEFHGVSVEFHGVSMEFHYIWSSIIYFYILYIFYINLYIIYIKTAGAICGHSLKYINGLNRSKNIKRDTLNFRSPSAVFFRE